MVPSTQEASEDPDSICRTHFHLMPKGKAGKEGLCIRMLAKVDSLPGCLRSYRGYLALTWSFCSRERHRLAGAKFSSATGRTIICRLTPDQKSRDC